MPFHRISLGGPVTWRAFPYLRPVVAWTIAGLLAGVAAMLLARYARSVTMVAPENDFADRMSEYLLDRLSRAEAEGWQPWPFDLEQALLRGDLLVDELQAVVDRLQHALRHVVGANDGIRPESALASFGFDHIHPEKDLQIVLVEAAPRLLSQLPDRLSESAVRELRKLAIEVHTNEKVVEVTADGLKMASGRVIGSTLTVWAAGVKAADFLKGLGGDTPLETNRLNQLVVTGNLQTTLDPSIFAFGDCAACPQPDGTWVPPRAQAAYQQAMYLAKALPRIAAGQAVSPFIYRDQGSLVSLSEYSSVGSLMGSLTRGSLFIEGRIAQFMYWSLHKQHQLALGGWKKMILITLSEMLDRTYRPRIKLH